MLNVHSGDASYHQVSQDSQEQALERAVTESAEPAKRGRVWKSAAYFLLLVLVGLIGHATGIMKVRAEQNMEKVDGTAPRGI